MREEITKEEYLTMVWSFIITGLIVNILSYTYIIFNYDFLTLPLTEIGLLTIGLLLTGFGVGLAVARSWKIKGYE